MTKLMDPIVGKLMGLRYKSHPWHGVSLGEEAPDKLTCFIEMVSTDTVKYEVDKESGYLCLDRPQKYSSNIPALYGFLPQTYSGDLVSEYSNVRLGRTDIKGDGDPLDICVLTEKNISHGDILVKARPIGGFRMIDQDEADDKIIAVLNGDAFYSQYTDISQLPDMIVERLKHYFLTYKDIPGEKIRCSVITDVYGPEEAKEVIRCAMDDYDDRFNNISRMLKI